MRRFRLALFVALCGLAAAADDAVPSASPAVSFVDETLPSFPEFKHEILAKQGKLDAGLALDEPALPVVSEQDDTAPSKAGVVKSKRVNYASSAVGASVMAHNPEAKGSGSLLTSDPDGYYMSPCSAKKWVVIGMSEDVSGVAACAAECCRIPRRFFLAC